MTLKVDWERTPEELRAAGSNPALYSNRDLLVMSLIILVAGVLAFISG